MGIKNRLVRLSRVRPRRMGGAPPSRLPPLPKTGSWGGLHGVRPPLLLRSASQSSTRRHDRLRPRVALKIAPPPPRIGFLVRKDKPPLVLLFGRRCRFAVPFVSNVSCPPVCTLARVVQ